MKWNVPTAWKQLWQRYKYILLVIVAGILLLMIPTGEKSENKGLAESQQQIDHELQSLEQKLESILSRIQHAGRVDVMLSVKESSHKVLAYDTKKSRDQTEYDTVIVSQGSGVQQPVVLHEIYPTFQGALIVCGGGDNPAVKLQIVEAVRALTGLSADRISVCKGT